MLRDAKDIIVIDIYKKPTRSWRVVKLHSFVILRRNQAYNDMVDALYAKLAATSALLGVLGHLLLWIRLELDTRSNDLIVLANLSLFCTPVALYFRGIPLSTSISSSLLVHISFAIGTFASIAIYRAFFHPLKSFPGPIPGKITTFWKVREFVKADFQNYAVFDRLHRQYGDFVRLGPRQLSISNPEAYHTIYGVNTECRRLVLMQSLRRNLQTLSNPHEHKARRKIWDHGLNARACQSYLPQINDTARKFCESMAKFEGQPVWVNDWCHFTTFDVMGLLGFGQSYGQLESGKAHPSIAKVQNFLKAGSIALQMLWVVNFLQLFPGLEDPIRDLKEWSQELLNQRAQARRIAKKGDNDRDLMTYVEESRKVVDSRWPMTDEDMAEDAALLQVAGSDTSYSVMVNLCHYLANHQELQEKIRSEVLASFESDAKNAEPTWSKLASAQTCPYLDATVNEILRISPAVLQGPMRQSPDYPIEVAGKIIPPKTLLSCPIYSIQRDERCFKYGDEFIPERWLDPAHPESRSELILDRRGFVPFSVGQMNCAGKYFAYMEVKVIVAHLLRQSHLVFPSTNEIHENKHVRRTRDQEHSLHTKDYLTQWSADVQICFLPREKS